MYVFISSMPRDSELVETNTIQYLRRYLQHVCSDATTREQTHAVPFKRALHTRRPSKVRLATAVPSGRLNDNFLTTGPKGSESVKDSRTMGKKDPSIGTTKALQLFGGPAPLLSL